MRKLNIIGRVFGRGTVFAEAPTLRSAKGITMLRSWLKCECGKDYIAFNSNLLSGKTTSCGCYRREFRRTHGHTAGYAKSQVYAAWDHMIRRCTDPNCKAYKNWGGRGIGFLPEWAEFEPFFAFMGPGKKGWSIHRVDNNAGYFPENMVWATPQFQMWYTRINKIVTVAGITASFAELCAKFKVPWHRTYSRLQRGWSLERAFGIIDSVKETTDK